MTALTANREGYKQTELGWIPEDWEVVRLDDIAFTRKSKINPNPEEINICIDLEHVEQHTGRLLEHSYSNCILSTKNAFESNDILFGKLRPYLRKYWYAVFKGICSTEFLVLSAKNNIKSKFLFYLIQKDSFINYSISKSFGTKMPRTSWQIMKEFILRLPPLPEQQKIAAILSTVDEKIDVIEAGINAGEKLKKALMRRLLTQGIGHFEFKKTEIGQIPKEWQLKRLINITSKEKGSLKRGPFGGSIKKSDFVESGYKVYEQKNVIKNNLNIGKYYINEEKFKELSDFAINENDFLISGSGTIGKIILVRNPFKRGIINQALVRVRLDNNIIDKNFFKHQFESDDMQKKIIANTQGGAMKNLVSMSDFKKIIFILPPLPEQQKIAEILSTMDEKLDILRKKKEAYQTLKKGLMQQLLTGAIRVTNADLNQEKIKP